MKHPCSGILDSHMCGRFAFWNNRNQVLKHFELDDAPDFRNSWNVTPSSQIPVITNGNGHSLVNCEWGLIPHWAKPGNRFKPINARAETVQEKPFFRDAFRKHRCLIPASGYYEWTGSKGNKQPWFITLADTDIFAFAGLHSRWESPDNIVDSCTIITTSANEATASIHDRMPVILSPGSYDDWLAKPDSSLLVPYDGAMDTWPVGKTVNRPGSDGEGLVQPLPT